MSMRLFLKDDGSVSYSSFFLFKHDPQGFGLQPYDQGSFVPSKREWDEIKKLIDQFYDHVPAHIIDEHNRHLLERECGRHFLGEEHKR